MKFTLRSSDLNSNGKHSLQVQFRQAVQSGAPIHSILANSPLPPTTTYRWISTDMSPTAQSQRQIHPRRAANLSIQEESKVLRIAKKLRENHQPVTIEVTRQIIAHVTNGRVPNCSKTWISLFWKKHGWPSRRVQQKNQKELRDSLKDEVAEFRNEVNQYVSNNNIPLNHIHVMDETGLWNGSVVQRTYCDPSTMDSGVLGKGDHRRDTGVVAISADGSVNSFFIKHVPQRTQTINGQRTIVTRGVSGMGLSQMDQWVTHFGSTHSEAEKSVLLMDRLKSHTNQKIVSRLENEYNIKVFHFPPQGAKYASVCDNSFFSTLKNRMSKKDTSTTEVKEKTFKELCSAFEPSIIQNYWRHCGWGWN